ncbi:sulfatase-like hydrolase/transferase [bacterium]|nr:sulfatase-like hydrolase/transferase [bacterium]
MRVLSVLLLLLLAACAPSGGVSGGGPGDAHRPPNVVVIFVDDMGYGDTGAQAAADIPTPHLDALARAGVQCTDAYVSAPLCFPSRAGLLTGRYAQRFGVEHHGRGFDLPAEQTTLAERMRDAGYATGLVGKWNLGTGDGLDPQSRGFDEFFGFDGLAHPYVPGRERRGGDDPIRRGRTPVEEGEYLTDAFARESCDFILRHAHEPFFLLASFNAPHTPLQPRKIDRKRFAGRSDVARAEYAAVVVALDDAVGAIDRTLRETGLDRSTLVLFVSDNGAAERKGGSNAPFRDGKGSLWEGGIHVPWFVRFPGRVPRGGFDATPVMQIDVAPTALAAAGALDDPAAFDGKNRLPEWTGSAAPGEAVPLFWRYAADEQMAMTNAWAIRDGRWKLTLPEASVRSGPPSDTEGMLFDLEADPSESTDVAAENPEVVARLRARYDEWNRTLPAPRGVR